MILFIIFINYLYFFFSFKALFIGMGFFLLFFLMIYFIVKKGEKIIPDSSHNFKKELLFTAINFVIYTILAHFIFLLYINGYFSFNWNFNYLIIFWFILFILGHDLYFYIIHRILHTKWFLRNVHYVHHNSHISSVFTSYSFHPIEGIMYTGILISIFIFPVNFYAFLLSVFYNDLLTILGHSGRENFSANILKSNKVFKFLATPTYHDMHHSRNRGNFALYFLYLDKIFGSYDKKHKDIISDKNK